MLKLLKNFFPEPDLRAHAAYIALVERARNPFFYEGLGVPDTLDGRFELIVLHLFLLQQRLRVAEGEEFSRHVSEMFFADMDRSVREIGVSDTGVRYRIKAMAKAYHGRLQAYSAATDQAQMCSALARNLYGTVENGSVEMLSRAAAYVSAMQEKLAAMDADAIMSDAFAWPAIK